MDNTVVVETLLSVSGLKLPPDELAEMAGAYPGIRASVDLLYAPEFTEADPFLVPAIAPVVAP
ncbi:MAG: hypothetical protein QOG36_1029 [Actinomycetota bacterium]|jgi:hypothetical protein|nr:hypothetical protein [Actinomycetota bacterium]